MRFTRWLFALTRPIRHALVAAHSRCCGRGASIRYCGYALPGDCRVCESLLDRLTITAN